MNIEPKLILKFRLRVGKSPPTPFSSNVELFTTPTSLSGLDIWCVYCLMGGGADLYTIIEMSHAMIICKRMDLGTRSILKVSS